VGPRGAVRRPSQEYGVWGSSPGSQVAALHRLHAVDVDSALCYLRSEAGLWEHQSKKKKHLVTGECDTAGENDS